MKSASRITRQEDKVPLLPLVNGVHMGQAEVHRRYETHPDDVKIELIDGVVYVASPQRSLHGRYEPELSGAVWTYKRGTPGVEVLSNSTTILGKKSEPQPDLQM